MLFFVSLLLFFFRRSYHFLNFLPIIFLIWLLQTLKYEQALYTSQKLKKKLSVYKIKISLPIQLGHMN